MLEAADLFAIRGLPPGSGILLWTEQQNAFVQNERIFWQYVGHYLDYAQQRSLGFRPPNPVLGEPNPRLQNKVEVYGEFFLAQFNLINAAWDKWIAPRTHHRAPRSFFVFLLTSLAEQTLGTCLQPVSTGLSHRTIIRLQQDLSGFYRGRWETKEEVKILDWLSDSQDYFWLPLIWRDRCRGDLKCFWEKFLAAHRQFQQFLKESQASIPHWHDGIPIGSRGERCRYASVPSEVNKT